MFKNGILVGGVGVVGPSGPISEYAAVVAAVSPPFAVTPPSPGVVFIGGLALPFVNQTTPPEGPGTADGSYLINPVGSPAAAPEGDLIAEHAGSALTLGDIQTIVQQAIATANTTRASIRLPLGSRARMVIARADLDGSLLALYRMVDSTIFSVDVAVANSRNVIYFSQNPGNDLPGVPAGTAVTNRAIYFGSQPLFRPVSTTHNRGPSSICSNSILRTRTRRVHRQPTLTRTEWYSSPVRCRSTRTASS